MLSWLQRWKSHPASPRFPNCRSAIVIAVLASGIACSQSAAQDGSVAQPSSGDAGRHPESLSIDADYPGGNIVVDRVEGDHLYVHPDLRDTKGDWFYWNFRVKNGQGRTLTVHFTGSNVIGVRGPAVSVDGGQQWRWLGAEAVRDQSFQYTCQENEREVRFCFAMPYVNSNLISFLSSYKDNPHLRIESLCESRKGREVKRIHAGRLDGQASHRVLLTCRHHCCEMMASYSLEGLLAAVLSDSEDGQWMQENVEFLVVPFMDSDGVEEGDQGKNRIPHDHNRDYSHGLYPEVRALRDYVATWSEGRLKFALDLHDPWIRGNSAEIIYFVENDGPTTENVRRFAQILEETCRGPLPFQADDNMRFGTGWNTPSNYAAGVSFSRWASNLPAIEFASTVEIPYANVRGQEVNADSARAFGADLTRALRSFLQSL